MSESSEAKRVPGKPLAAYWTAAGDLVVTGIPPQIEDEESPDYHNCDVMGCGQEHVIARTRYGRQVAGIGIAGTIPGRARE